MPHKHSREKTKSDPAYWDLPPSKAAQSLESTSNKKDKKPRRSEPPKKEYSTNDTPRAFHRLFQPYRPPRSGQDDGTRPSKKRKVASSTLNNEADAFLKGDRTDGGQLQIGSYEPLSHFSARVDAALPFALLPKSQSKPDPALKGIGKPRKTKLEKKMHKMQQAWREETKARKEKILMEGEDWEGAVDESNIEELGVDEGETKSGSRTKRHGNHERAEDLWRDVKAKKREKAEGREKQRGLVGLHDVVQAPPRFKKRAATNDESVKVKHGGLKKQRELSDARKSVIEGYRAMMKQRREGICVS